MLFFAHVMVFVSLVFDLLKLKLYFSIAVFCSSKIIKIISNINIMEALMDITNEYDRYNYGDIFNTDPS